VSKKAILTREQICYLYGTFVPNSSQHFLIEKRAEKSTTLQSPPNLTAHDNAGALRGLSHWVIKLTILFSCSDDSNLERLQFLDYHNRDLQHLQSYENYHRRILSQLD
jgi:hypothetical protein